MYCTTFQIVEKVVKLRFDCFHHCCTAVYVDIVIIINTIAIMLITLVIAGMLDFKVSAIGVFRHGQVLIMHVVSVCVVHPIVGSVLDAMRVVVLINMLRMVLAIVTVGVIMAKVMVSLRLNIVVLTVLLSGEVTLVAKMRLVILQVPVTLLEVGIRVMLITVHQRLHQRLIIPVMMLKRCLFIVPVTCGGKVLLSALRLLFRLLLRHRCRCRLCYWLLFLSFSFWLGIWLRSLIRVVVVEIVVSTLVHVFSMA